MLSRQLEVGADLVTLRFLSGTRLPKVKSAGFSPSPPMLNGRLAPVLPTRVPKLARRAVVPSNQ